MIRSAAIIKDKALSPAKELRQQKKRLKKQEAIERKATKVHRPSPIGYVKEVINEVPDIDLNELTREEMLQQSDKIGLVVNKHWSNATLLKHINDAMGI
jgi:rRNA maturation endonuclease Nob1